MQTSDIGVILQATDTIYVSIVCQCTCGRCPLLSSSVDVAASKCRHHFSEI